MFGYGATTEESNGELTWWNLFGFVMIFNTINFVLAYFVLDDLSIVDITWGIMHTIPLIAIAYYEGGDLSAVQMLVLALVSLWAFRLSFHIGMRH